jgi:hypothetical protein
MKIATRISAKTGKEEPENTYVDHGRAYQNILI